MNYHSLITTCTSYIRNHASEEITAQDLSALCGYSLYHLSSVFRACLGCSVGRFILEERLRLAAEMILMGRKITSVAMDSGFDTSSGFTRAFRRQFGCSPREYRTLSQKETALADPVQNLQSIRPGHAVQPQFVKRSALKVYGYVIPVREDHINEDPLQSGKAAFWSQVDFKAFPSYPEDASDYAEIGTWINPDPTTGRMDYFFGYVTSDLRPAEGFHEISLAPGDYAVFRISYPESETGNVLPARVRDLWLYIFGEWFSNNSAMVFDDSRLCFEKYGAAEVEICVPILSAV